ncbi:hypothetical protein [Methylobacterium gregans]|uniref:hypothetical protein n=1 Tax=Methylobacterium gregans TaxID=374424 RepID=UPI0036118693
MRTLRLLTGGCVVGLSTLIVGFVSADRLNHLAPPPVTRATVPEPSATGSIAVPRPAAPVAPRRWRPRRCRAVSTPSA